MNETAVQIKNGIIPTGYKKTEAGIIPKDWDCAKLSEIADPITETAGKKKYETVSISAGIGFMNQAEKFGKELSGKQYEKYIVLKKGDFSYNKGNSGKYPQGCIYRLKDRETAAVPNVFESFRLKDGYCPEYYDYLFTSGFLNRQLTRKINHGVRDDGLLNLTGKDFYDCVLPVPPLAEQKRIAEILEHCDRTIQLWEDKTAAYRNLKKIFLKKIFLQEGSNIPQIRFPGFKDAWEQRKLIDEVSSVDTGKSKFIAHETGEYKILGSTSIIGYDDSYDYEGDFLLTARVGANAGELYRHSGKVKISDNTVFIQGSQLDFIYYALIHFDIKRLSFGTGQPLVKASELKKQLLSMPVSEAEREKIGRFFHNLDTLISLHQRKCDEEKQRKKILMQFLLKGIVRVN